MRPLQIAALLTLLVAAPAEGDEIERNSVPVKPATEAKEGWRTFGFRLSLQLGWQRLSPVRESVAVRLPAGDGLALGIEPGIRLTRSLAVSVALHYAAPSGREDGNPYSTWSRPPGLLWGTTANVAWFPVDTVYLGAGAGYGGLLGTDCHATGVMLLARAGAQLVVSDVFAMGPLVQLGGTAVGCKNSSDHAPWLHDELFLAWDFSWR